MRGGASPRHVNYRTSHLGRGADTHLCVCPRSLECKPRKSEDRREEVSECSEEVFMREEKMEYEDEEECA